MGYPHWEIKKRAVVTNRLGSQQLRLVHKTKHCRGSAILITYTAGEDYWICGICHTSPPKSVGDAALLAGCCQERF